VSSSKRIDLPYQAGNRDGMQKIKRMRSADCVIGGFRYGEKRAGGRKVVGSLLLGLYDDEGRLNHVGFSSGLKSAQKAALTDKLEAIASDRSFTGNAPRWPKPLVDQAVGGMAAAQAEINRRGVLRPFHRWPLSARHDNPALAARQEAAAMHHGAAPSEVGAAGNVAPQARLGRVRPERFVDDILSRHERKELQ